MLAEFRSGSSARYSPSAAIWIAPLDGDQRQSASCDHGQDAGTSLGWASASSATGLGAAIKPCVGIGDATDVRDGGCEKDVIRDLVPAAARSPIPLAAGRCIRRLGRSRRSRTPTEKQRGAQDGGDQVAVSPGAKFGHFARADPSPPRRGRVARSRSWRRRATSGSRSLSAWTSAAARWERASSRARARCRQGPRQPLCELCSLVVQVSEQPGRPARSRVGPSVEAVPPAEMECVNKGGLRQRPSLQPYVPLALVRSTALGRNASCAASWSASITPEQPAVLGEQPSRLVGVRGDEGQGARDQVLGYSVWPSPSDHGIGWAATVTARLTSPASTYSSRRPGISWLPPGPPRSAASPATWARPRPKRQRGRSRRLHHLVFSGGECALEVGERLLVGSARRAPTRPALRE